MQLAWVPGGHDAAALEQHTRSARLIVDSRWAMTSVVRLCEQRVERVVDRVLDLDVDGAGGVVEHEDRRVDEQRAGDGDALALAARERVAPLADDGVVAVGELHDEVVGVGRLGRGHDLLDRWRRAGRRRCCRGPTTENRNGSSSTRPTWWRRLGEGEVAHVVAVDAHRARRRRRRSGRAGGRRWTCPRRCGPTSATVSPGAMRRSKPSSTVRRRSAVARTSTSLELDSPSRVDEVDGARPVDDLGRLVEDLEDALGRRRRPLAHHHQQPSIRNGACSMST